MKQKSSESIDAALKLLDEAEHIHFNSHSLCGWTIDLAASPSSKKQMED